jgi:hypothetical protein
MIKFSRVRENIGLNITFGDSIWIDAVHSINTFKNLVKGTHFTILIKEHLLKT